MLKLCKGERKAALQLVSHIWNLFLMDSVTIFKFVFKPHYSWHYSNMHCSKKLRREGQVLVSCCTSFVIIKEQLKTESAGSVNFSEIEELNSMS